MRSKPQLKLRCSHIHLSDVPLQLPLLSITVKQLPGGMASTYLHALKEGDTVYLLPPAGDFVLQPLVAPADRAPTGQVHLFFAAGSGIAPVLPMLTSALAKGESAALLYCSRRRADVIFQTELDKLVAEQEDLVRREAGQRRGRILLLQHCFSKELRPAGRAQSAAEVGAAAERGMPTVVNVVADSTVGACTQQEWCGRLTGKRVQSFYRTATSRAALGASSSPASAASASVVQCYMCGPAEWMDVIQQALEEEGAMPFHSIQKKVSCTPVAMANSPMCCIAGVPCAAIHSEDFGAAEGLLAVDYEAAGVQAETRSAVIMDKNASERKVVVEAYQSVLNAALSRGVAVPYSCK